MTFDSARPLHAFDADRLEGDLIVRKANNGEQLKALDGNIYKLDETMTVIADAKGVQAIGGIIGGEHSGCSEYTCLLYTSPSPRDKRQSRMPSSA